MAKQTMGKDDNGVFHPGKGKPSGINKEEGLGIQATPPEKMDEYLEITDKYTIGEDTLDPSVPVRHPNRNTSKGEDTYKGKENKVESNKSNNQTFDEDRTQTEVEELPGVLTKERFTELANYNNDCCISLFLGAHPAGVEVNEHFDVTNFKNQLQEIARRLKDKGYDQTFIEPLLEPGYELVRNEQFWTSLSPGLAVFIAKDYFKFIKMPVVPSEELVIEPTFFVTPLVPLMMSKEYFYLLVISKQCAKLFKGDAYGMQIVPVELPQSIQEVKRLSDSDATTFRSGSSGARAPRQSQEGAYHGVGGGNPEDKDNILVYFEAVDDMLWDEVLNKENAPLVLAGVEYEIPIYKSACDYHNVWPEALTGNRDRQETKALYEEAKALLKPFFDQKLNRALETYGNNSANGLTSSIAADVIPAAYYSQVSHLFVCKGEHIWGTFDEMANELLFHDTPDEDGEDLLDHAVVKTLANGGEVYLLEKEQMPSESQVAAIMRF
ncbi:hypothetical protein EXU57_19800 [Segetibacter sp. 3557_3]|uniref:baeRF7 domain-containing protein n=1 Tax=Segetibacter sp. 3557_3 TaxID=2547429 RepID=UPI00105906F7|nr:hypothetical protein [Segetibacter sp. 3557_3]TDH21442.1 hypothetical protein EXU57_19800 [Segetibacter sp. 3557_3]